VQQTTLIESDKDNNRTHIGNGISLEIRGSKNGIAIQYDYDREIKRVDLSDKTAKRIFIVDLVERGVNQTKLADKLQISRQSINNYVKRKRLFGLEGLMNSYSVAPGTSLEEQRKENQHKLPTGNINQQVAEIAKKERIAVEKAKKNGPYQPNLPFDIEKSDECKSISLEEQPFTEKHNWLESRYAGVFVYIIQLFSQQNILTLLGGYFGNHYKIFMIFILMVARNIRSLEQLKNIRKREAGLILGLGRIPSKPKVWEWFYRAAHLKVGQKVLDDFFRYQIRAGLVGCSFLFTDGHLLPYSGKSKVHCGFSTQRSTPLPGQTNIVTCDLSGRIVDFNIQEGLGDLRAHISDLSAKWSEEMPGGVIHVFDREGYGGDFFHGLREKGICFVTWDKHVDRGKLAEIPEDQFTEKIEVNGKQYRYFEQSKDFTITTDENEKETFSLRRIILWNVTAKRRTAGLAYTADYEISSEDCVVGILNRWGASENTFKHIKERHPYHYHPGFALVESENQEIANPILKELKVIIKKTKQKIVKLKSKLADIKPSFKKDGSARKNSAHVKLKEEISEHELVLDQTQDEAKQEPERVETSDIENYQKFKRVDNEGKKLFDLITSSVWNARKDMVDWLRPHWNLENEIVDLFYAITQCHGWIRSDKHEVRVRLEPLEQPSRRSAQERLCRKLTYLATRLPSGKLMVIEVGEDPR
jgi:transposase